MDRETELVIGSVVDLILSERHVTDGEVIEVSSVGGLKSCDGDVCLGIELFCNSSRDAVQLNAVELAVLHRLWQTAEEVTDTHRRLQNVAGLKAHIANSFIDSLDDGRTCVVSVQRGASRCGVFFGRKGRIEFRKLILPVVLCLVKGICKTTPTDVFRKDFLFFLCGLSAVKLQFFQKVDSIHVHAELCFCTAFAQVVVGDAEVVQFRFGFCYGRLCRQLRITLCFADLHEPAHKFNGFTSKNREVSCVLKGHVLQAHSSKVEIYAVHDKSAVVNLKGRFTRNKVLACELLVGHTRQLVGMENRLDFITETRF